MKKQGGCLITNALTYIGRVLENLALIFGIFGKFHANGIIVKIGRESHSQNFTHCAAMQTVPL